MEIPTIITHLFLFVALYTEVFLLLAFLEAREDRAGAPRKVSPLPSVAIIVPCFNEEETVRGTIESLLALDYPQHRFSIVAVNDGSTDNTLTALQHYEAHPQVTVLSKENGGKHSAMNLALQQVTADIVGCLDADSFVDPSALKASVSRFLSSDAAAVTPAIVSMRPDNWLRFIQQAEYALSVFMRRAFADTNAVFITPGPFSLFRADVLRKIGGWKHAHGTEDMEIAMRLHAHGYTITNEPRARVFTKTPRTIPALYRQRVRWTYGFIMNAWDYRHMVLNRGFGALGMVVLPAAIISIGAALYFTGMVLLHAAGETYDAIRRVLDTGVSVPHPTFDLFFVNTASAVIIAYILIALALTLLYIGRSLSETRLHPLSVPLYIGLYSLLAPWWLMGAVSRAALRAQAPWR